MNVELIVLNCFLHSSCVLSYHHFENPAEMTRSLAQRLKPKGRLLVVDFVDDGGLAAVFRHRENSSHGDIVAHKHGSFFVARREERRHLSSLDT